MTVRDVLINTAVLIGRTDIISYFGEQTKVGEDTYEDIMFLLKIINLVVHELSTTYCPLITKQRVNFYEGYFAYADLNKKVIKILNVYDREWKEVAFKDEFEYVSIEDTNSYNDFFIEYQHLPEEYTEESEIGYDEIDVSPKIIAFGVAAEYCLSQGLFDEAVMNHKRYVSAIQDKKVIKNVKIKGRSFR